MTVTCSIPECTRPRKYKATGWCQTHYHRWYRTGATEDPTPIPIDWWKQVAYRTAHTRIERALGKASACSCMACGGPAAEWAYDGTDPTEIHERLLVQGVRYPVAYSRFPEFYAPMCTGCHRAFDAAARAERRDTCKHGHEYTAENTKIRIRDGQRSRVCLACSRGNAARRYQNRKVA